MSSHWRIDFGSFVICPAQNIHHFCGYTERFEFVAPENGYVMRRVRRHHAHILARAICPQLFQIDFEGSRSHSDTHRSIAKMPSENVVVNKVIVHPLVLLSVVDHFNRMGKIGNQKRVVGVLLGCWRQKGVLDVSNSFAGTYVWVRSVCERQVDALVRSVGCRPSHLPHISHAKMDHSSLTDSHEQSVRPPHSQFPSTRMTKTNRFGSWIMIISIACTVCSKK